MPCVGERFSFFEYLLRLGGCWKCHCRWVHFVLGKGLMYDRMYWLCVGDRGDLISLERVLFFSTRPSTAFLDENGQGFDV